MSRKGQVGELVTKDGKMEEKARILIVDDDESVRRSLSLILEKKGYQVEAAGTGKEALERAQKKSFSVALVDIKLPDADGIELVALLKEAHPETEAVIVTGHASLDTSVQAVDKGVFAYLIKPLNMDEVLQKVQDIVSRQHLVQEKQRAEAALRERVKELTCLFSVNHEMQTQQSIETLCYYVIQSLIPAMQFPDIAVPVIELNGERFITKRYSDGLSHGLHAEIRSGEKALGQLSVYYTEDKPFQIPEEQDLLNTIGEDLGLWLERKQAEEALEKERNLLRTVIDNLPDTIYAKDTENRYVVCNIAQAHSVAAEITPDDVVGKTDVELYPKELAVEYRANDETVIRTGQRLLNKEERGVDLGGNEVWLLSTKVPLRDAAGEIAGLVGISRDITGRRQAEQKVQQLNQYLESIVDNANVWLDVVDKDTNIVLWNKAAEEISGYSRDEVVGRARVWEWLYPDETYRREVLDAAVIYGRESYVDDETSIRTKDGQTKVISWNERPLLDEGGKLVGSIAIGRDVTAQKRAADKLQRALEGTIQAIGLTTETRDPYTAGHQRRVTLLASAIAREMGLSEEQVESIRVAGLVHDIGKMSVPAEILSKPSKLTEIEFGLIKAHPQVAYDILATIEFPWPIAQIVLQHHERMDGSGYPQGLKGEEIVLEARILAVADVVEAMASHRPYRPALGVEKSLEEICDNKDKLYDSGVVDACVQLFSEGRFEFED